jgi:heptosyltransferase II
MIDNPKPESEIKVMLLAPNWLGDAVMFSALIEYLYCNRVVSDGRRLVFELAVRSNWAPLFQDDSRLEKLILVDRNGRHGGLLGGWRLGGDFRRKKPDTILLGPPSFRAGVAAWRSGAAIRVGFRGDGRSALLNHSMATPVRGQSHHSDELVELGGLLFNALDCEIPAHDIGVFLPTLPGCDSIPEIKPKSNTPIWIFAPGATYGSAKSWPLIRGLDFVRAAIKDRRVRLVLLGDSSASAYAAALADGLDMETSTDLDGGPGLVDLTGRTDLHRVVAILKTSQAFVGIDSGLMHLSAALGVPTVGVFGSSNPDWTSPKGISTQVVNAEGFACRPCYLKSCNQKEFCLESISADVVFSAMDQMLSLDG